MCINTRQAASLAAVTLFSLAAAPPASAQLVRSGAGAGATTARDQFRLDLGGGTTAGANGLFSDATGARREINWDGVGDAFSAPNNLPANFFNANSPRGAVFSTPGTGFQLSANAANPTGTPVEFGNLDPSYPAAFAAFSPQRLFTALGSNIVDVNFFVPGTNAPAVVRGFGSIFTDVDLANTTSIQYFSGAGTSLGTFFAPNVAGTNESVSFLGVSFSDAVIARVRITNGNVAPGAGILDQNGNPSDVVVMDDFLYAEPQAQVIPEPASGVLLASAGAFWTLPLIRMALRRRRRAW